MFRLFIICIIFLLLYLGFSIIEALDSPAILTIYNYQIETTFFAGIAFGLFSLIIGFALIKLFVLIIDLPFKLQRMFNVHKVNNDNYSLTLSMAEYIIGNKIKAGTIAKKISPTNNKKENKDFYNLILATTTEDIDKQIVYFQELAKSREFKFYSIKNLAILYYSQNSYKEAESYAIDAYNLNEFDSVILVILINCYGKLALWEKFTFVVNKLARIDKQQFTSISQQIVEYYLLAAKNKIAENNDGDATDYLEWALNLDLVNIEILELYLRLNSDINLNKKIKILKNAFNIYPSLEIVQIFQKFTDLSNYQIYDALSEKFNTTKNLTLSLAIAAYLNLPDKIKEITEST